MSEANTSVIFIVVIGTILFLLLVIFIFSFFILHVRRNRIYREEKNKLVQSFQEELLKSQLEIQEQTLAHVSQEIHDNIGQVLTLARLNISSLLIENRMSDDRLDNVKDLIGKAISDLRDISKTLNRDYFAERGLIESITSELEIVRKSGKHTISFQREGEIPVIQAQKELILFRIFQEALNNTIKHSGATDIHVNLRFFQNNIFMEITDNGAGFDIAATEIEKKEDKGMGIRSMQKRAKLIGGTLDLESQSNAGTKVKFSCPLN
ncbi:MAG: sensor histidine kinase [Flavitalea sp.]